MRIVVNDTAASFGGAMTVLKSFYEYVKENDKENEYIFLLSGPYLEETENIKIRLLPAIKKSALHKLWFDFFSGKKLFEELNPDRVVSLQNIINFGYKGEQWVYVHQSIPFQTVKKFSFWRKKERFLAVCQFLIGAIVKMSVKKAKRTFVQTEWMKKSVAAQCNVSDEKISVIPFAISDSETSYSYCGNGKRFFYPAMTEEIYKNHAVIFEADRILKKAGIDRHTIVLTLDKSNEDSSTVVFCGRLDKQKLYEEYARSVLVFPSYIETVGLPLIEAMNLGAPIIIADCEYSREVIGEYKNVLFFDPFDPDALACCIAKSMSGEFSSDGRVGRRTAENDGWEKMTKLIISGE